MKLVFERIQEFGHPLLKDLFALYEGSFPPEERREPEKLLKFLDEPQMYFSALLLEEQCVGLLIYWRLEGFLYIEHFAVYPDRRGQGIGTSVLLKLQKLGDPILLEVEMPYDPLSQKRVSFYKRCGFNSLPINYFQPPYREGESLLPMMLFSDRSDWQEESLKRAIALFHFRVYQYQSN